jgi:predicted transposase YbfD/YdcC
MIDKKADYFFTLKDNDRAKKKEFALQFKIKPSLSSTTVDKGHGRVEERTLKVMPVPDYLKDWPGVQHMCQITRKRWKKGKETCETVYAITSLTGLRASAENLLRLNRAHWAIENQLHRVRDTTFNEDRATLRKGSSPQLMACLRNTAIQIIKRANLAPAYALHLGSRFPKRMLKLIIEN